MYITIYITRFLFLDTYYLCVCVCVCVCVCFQGRYVRVSEDHKPDRHQFAKVLYILTLI